MCIEAVLPSPVAYRRADVGGDRHDHLQLGWSSRKCSGCDVADRAGDTARRRPGGAHDGGIKALVKPVTASENVALELDGATGRRVVMAGRLIDVDRRAGSTTESRRSSWASTRAPHTAQLVISDASGTPTW